MAGLARAGLATAALATIRESTSSPRLQPIIPAVGAAAGSLRASSDCRRWRSVAARLGETYAGYRLRQTIVARACAYIDDTAEDDHWSWPWRDADIRTELPPRIGASHGVWQIRCGTAGRRTRCVLATTSALEGTLDPDQDDLPLVSHFVIDSVSGREVLLWRMHVGADIVRVGGIDVTVGDRRSNEAFDVCGRRNCILETETKLSAEAANALWDGKPVALSIGAGKGQVELRTLLSAAGFRTGLAELMRLRRNETRTLAGR